MAQEQTKNTVTPDAALKDGKVRPKSKVQVLFRNSPFHGGIPYHLSMVHPALAEKLVEQGKAEYHEGDLSKAQIRENEEHKRELVKAKGRTPGKKKNEEDDDFDEDEVSTSKSGVISTKTGMKELPKK
ncbi:MAG TPA: hypothetical protein VEA37_02205 [Flavobacterium sp.]|nr:hypothetical protein [Flavobacterium sp.]